MPGAVRAWAEALRRHGTIPLDVALAPAIQYAEHGFAVSEKLAADIAARARVVGEVSPSRNLFRNPVLARPISRTSCDVSSANASASKNTRSSSMLAIAGTSRNEPAFTSMRSPNVSTEENRFQCGSPAGVTFSVRASQSNDFPG